jgi:hypothetical protein
MARYEWVHDLKNDFRGEIGSTLGGIDLAGAFADCPIPTLILEGRWDLTWNPDKPELLARDHPGSKLVVFDNAGHGVYDEDPDRFFVVLGDFIRTLAKVAPAAVTSYKHSVEEWDRRQKASPAYMIRTAGFGHAALESLAKAYTRSWCDIVSDLSSLLKIGFAQYESRNYAKALWVFERLQQAAEKKDQPLNRAVALTWQGHMLDLLGQRTEAVARYQQVVDAKVQGAVCHEQYGLEYDFTTYPKIRLEQPFTRVENREN